MIAATLLSLTLIGVLIALAAWTVDRACLRLALPRRFTWLVAMLAMAGAPLLPDGILTRVPVDAVTAPASQAAASPTVPSDTRAADDVGSWWPPYGATLVFFGASPVAALLAASNGIAASATLLRPLDGALLALWLAASLLMLALTLHAALRLQRQERHWITRNRGGVRSPAIYVSEDVGPAAYGIGRGDIVIPRWAMNLPPSQRRLLLLHERSHVEAGDPRLLAFGMTLLILLPWHLPLRWAYRRLQRAIELDCDRRVLHRPQLARRYAELLLHVAERGVTARGWSQRALSCLGGPNVTMTSLMCGEPALETRLRALVAPPVTLRARLDASAGLAMGTMLTLVACTVPIPQQLSTSPIPSFARFAASGVLQRDAAWTNGVGGEAAVRSLDSERYFARTDSLLIDAIERTNPAIMRLAQTAAPYVAVALTPDNEIIAHSIEAGAPPSVATSDSVATALTMVHAAAEAGLGTSGFSDAIFRGKMALAANEPNTFIEGLGISHLRVGENPLTVLWVRFKQRGAN
jgi:beta-lactamase regulating signal transducer with metallopeptidase domain